MAQALSENDWGVIHASVVADIAKRRTGQPPRFKFIPLTDLVRYRRLPIHQSIDQMVEWSVADLARADRVPLFISHRWHSSYVPDDGSLIGKIFIFCLSVVIKNNFPHLTAPVEVHHSKHLSARLNAVLGTLEVPEVLHGPPSFGDFDNVLRDVVPDSTQADLIRVLLNRVHIWIDYCCLPQEVCTGGRVVSRTRSEDEQFLSGLDGMDTLLHHAECVLLWPQSEVTRAWLFYEAMMSIPMGRASFMAPMDLIASLSTIVRLHHKGLSKLGLLNSIMMIDAFKDIGITATSHRDIGRIVFLMSENLRFSEWRFRVIQ